MTCSSGSNVSVANAGMIAVKSGMLFEDISRLQKLSRDIFFLIGLPLKFFVIVFFLYSINYIKGRFLGRF